MVFVEQLFTVIISKMIVRIEREVKMFGDFWWVFVVIGIFLMVMEIFTPGFIIMWFGVAFIIAAIPVYFQAQLSIVILTFTFSLLILTIFIRKIVVGYFSKSSKSNETNTSSIIGSIGVVVEEINPLTSSGKVRVKSEVWTSISENDEVIPTNSTIIVKKVDGVKLIVKKEN